jgi:hypothetical protein
MIRGLALAVIAATTFAANDICSAADTGFDDADQNALVCYAGTFLTKMLGELNASPALGASRKTQQHVRVHLLPYLGGVDAIAALKTDIPQNSNCTICYNDSNTFDGLTWVRTQVPSVQLAKFDAMDICYMHLADAVMGMLPKGPDGVFLVPVADPNTTTPFVQTVSMFKTLFKAQAGGTSFCPKGTADTSQIHRFYREPSPAVGKHWNNSDDDMPMPMPTWVDSCDVQQTGLTNPDEAAVMCYVANFLQWMLCELSQSVPKGQARKTEEHVRIHLLPYLGSEAVINALNTDHPSDPNCTACYNDPPTATHVESWTTGVPAKQLAAFKKLNVCYAPMTDYIMQALPKDEHGFYLVPPLAPDTPFSLTLKIMKGIFAESNARACPSPVSSQ